MKHTSEVITYADARGNTKPICTACIAAMRADETWIINQYGEEFATVSMGPT